MNKRYECPFGVMFPVVVHDFSPNDTAEFQDHGVNARSRATGWTKAWRLASARPRIDPDVPEDFMMT